MPSPPPLTPPTSTITVNLKFKRHPDMIKIRRFKFCHDSINCPVGIPPYLFLARTAIQPLNFTPHQ
ncbi:hypothetical protein CsSME_00038264 [Camellia sinensis var. sinensis]